MNDGLGTIGRLHLTRAAAVVAFLLAVAQPADLRAAAPKPKLSLKAAPNLGTPSTVFVFQARLTGGEDTEDLYCLSTEWTWEEQADSSINEAECPPFKAGETKVERTFSEEQSFHSPGSHVVRVVLRKGDKEIATAGTTVIVREDR